MTLYSKNDSSAHETTIIIVKRHRKVESTIVCQKRQRRDKTTIDYKKRQQTIQTTTFSKNCSNYRKRQYLEKATVSIENDT